jgi:hypothetical protein
MAAVNKSFGGQAVGGIALGRIERSPRRGQYDVINDLYL